MKDMKTTESLGEMTDLQYFNGTDWLLVGEFFNESFAWISLGGDDSNYRTLDSEGKVLTDKSTQTMEGGRDE